MLAVHMNLAGVEGLLDQWQCITAWHGVPRDGYRIRMALVWSSGVKSKSADFCSLFHNAELYKEI